MMTFWLAVIAITIFAAAWTLNDIRMELKRIADSLLTEQESECAEPTDNAEVLHTKESE